MLCEIMFNPTVNLPTLLQMLCEVFLPIINDQDDFRVDNTSTTLPNMIQHKTNQRGNSEVLYISAKLERETHLHQEGTNCQTTSKITSNRDHETQQDQQFSVNYFIKYCLMMRPKNICFLY